MAPELNPDTLVFFENNIVRLAEAKVSILTHALNYGTGVFEGIRGYWPEGQNEMYLLRARDHYMRWKQNCGIVKIDVPLTANELCDLTAELVRRNRFETNVYVRPLAYKSAPRIGVHPNGESAFAIVAVPFGDYVDSRKGLHAGVSSWRRIQDNAIPARAKICGAYVNSAMAGEEARQSGFDEAILLTEDGYVAEGSAANIFQVRGGVLSTPSVTDNILEGITRDCIMELARRELHVEVVERRLARSELYVADELFFTGTAMELAPIVRVDHRPVGAGGIGPVATRLRQIYAEVARGHVARFRKWLTPCYNRTSSARVA